MNKKLILSIACFGLVLTLSACGTATNPQNNEAANDRPNRRPDFGQPDTQPEIRGLVKSVVGNEVTVLKIDQPQRGASSSTPNGEAASTRKNSLSLGGTGNGGSGMRPGGGMGGGEARPGGEAGTDTNRTELLAQIKAMSTGEEKIVIPVGIKMLKADSNNSRTMVEATISDVTADKMITVWLNSAITDKKVASFVLIN